MQYSITKGQNCQGLPELFKLTLILFGATLQERILVLTLFSLPKQYKLTLGQCCRSYGIQGLLSLRILILISPALTR